MHTGIVARAGPDLEAVVADEVGGFLLIAGGHMGRAEMEGLDHFSGDGAEFGLEADDLDEA